jgi:hypothetical protein
VLGSIKKFNLLSCKRYSELASRQLDEQLSGWDKFFHRFHHAICLVCRRFARQIQVIDSASKCQLHNHVIDRPEGPRLSQAVRSRIASRVAEAGRPVSPSDS